MRIAVFGAGGVGGYFGGRLAQAGEDVVFIARGEHLQALRRDGLRIDSLAGDFSVAPVAASDDPAAIGPVDAVLVAVKTWQVAEAAERIGPLLGPNTRVIPLLNGVEAAGQLAVALGAERVLQGLCGLIAYRAGPGHIRHVGAEPFVRFGRPDNRPDSVAERLCAAFGKAVGVSADIPADIEAAVWRKFLLIAPWSGVGAVTRAPVGLLRHLPGSRDLLVRAMRETHALAQARGVDLPASAIDDALGFIDSLPESSTASMQRDIMKGRPSELEAQNGAVVRLGREAGVETPVNGFLYHALQPQEQQARGG